MYSNSIEKDSSSNVGCGDIISQSPYASENIRHVMAYYVLSRILSGISGVLFSILLVRHMLVIDYSRFATIIGAAGTIGVLSSLGIEKAVTRFVPEGRIQHKGKALARFIWRLLTLRIAVLLTMTVVLVGCWSYFSSDRTYPVELFIPIFLVIASANAFQFLSLLLQSLVQQKMLARIMVVQWAGRLALLLLIISVFSNVGLESALYILAAPDMVGSVLLSMILWQHLKNLSIPLTADPGATGTWPVWHNVNKIMRHNYGYSWLITPPQGNSMIVIASSFLTSLQIAAYGFFVNLIERIRTYLPLNFMLNLAEPLLVACYVGDQNFQNLCRRANLLYKPNFAFLLLFLAWTCSVSDVLTSFLTGGKYSEYSLILPLVIAQVTLGSHNTILQVIVNSVGRSEILSKSGAAALSCMTISAAVLLYIGSGKLTLLTTPLVFEMANIITTIYLLKRAGFAYNWDAAFHLKVLFATGIAFVTTKGVLGIIEGMVYRVLAAGVISTLAFVVVSKCLRIIEFGDLIAAKKLIRGRQSVDR
jgi:pyruvyl transferase EpsO